MNSWQQHDVQFAAAEGLTKNQTSIRVRDEEVSPGDRAAEIDGRIFGLAAGVTDGQLLNERTKLTDEAKKDPGYKFLMMVAAFSRQRFGNMVYERRARLSEPRDSCSGGACPFPRHDVPAAQWLNSPEITGVVQISSSVYGHIKEAEMIAKNVGVRVPLKELIETEEYAVPFARLTAIRISLSATMTGLGNRRDRTFQRLHQEQSMILKQFGRICRVYHDWTKPVAPLL